MAGFSREGLIQALNNEFKKKDNEELPSAERYESRFDNSTRTLYCGSVSFKMDDIESAERYFEETAQFFLGSAGENEDRARKGEFCKIAAEAIRRLRFLGNQTV
ncbi:MAG: hypothetical protein K5641_01555 [Lachnospiraceae bacterium]|nr:hypothetical protein [Lachnospiraceae bacterium]